MLLDQPLNVSQLMCPESDITGQRYRIEPELCAKSVSVDMDVRRLVRLMAVEIEPVWPNSQNGCHSKMSMSSHNSRGGIP